ncbi:TIGR04282 family arsenosugar biosynthesis glycosyltransferase [Bradyrhizobium sp.]|uniref:TIGR04282 family arsenosugar biosynthesis glycosyltransferase n=1 Tax=Bradyrhizobium sp. TaxID=376 RepID=UPI00403847D0
MRNDAIEPIQLAIFAKAPIPGYAKTRLISVLGAEGAADLQALLLGRTIQTALASSLRPITLWCAPDTTHEIFMSLHKGHDIDIHAQVDGDLGTRMLAAFEQLTEHGPALLIGTDCPTLSAGHLDRCASALREGMDAAFIPAEDGGYVLIGLRRPHRSLFEDIAFGTDEVMRQTRERLNELGLSAFEADALWDVDTSADYQRAQSDGLLTSEVDRIGTKR